MITFRKTFPFSIFFAFTSDYGYCYCCHYYKIITIIVVIIVLKYYFPFNVLLSFLIKRQEMCFLLFFNWYDMVWCSNLRFSDRRRIQDYKDGLYRSNRSQMVFKKVVLKNFARHSNAGVFLWISSFYRTPPVVAFHYKRRRNGQTTILLISLLFC